MKLIFCLDDEGGVSLFGKRQSRDRYLCDDIIAESCGSTLEMSAYSAKLFENANITVIEEPSFKTDSCYFCEVKNPEKYINLADKVIVYRWNRLYPSDVKFDTDLTKNGFVLSKVFEFEGSSHEKITEEKYVKGDGALC